MVRMYLVNKPQVFEQIVQWLLLFIEYDFITYWGLGDGCCTFYNAIDLPKKNYMTSTKIVEYNLETIVG